MRAGLHEQYVEKDGDRGQRPDRKACDISRAPSQRSERMGSTILVDTFPPACACGGTTHFYSPQCRSAMPRSGRLPRATGDARSDADRRATGCLHGHRGMPACGEVEPGTHVSMQSRNGADRSTFMCTPDAWDAPPPYSLGQWCQRPLKRTLKQDPGRDA